MRQSSGQARKKSFFNGYATRLSLGVESGAPAHFYLTITAPYTSSLWQGILARLLLSISKSPSTINRPMAVVFREQLSEPVGLACPTTLETMSGYALGTMKMQVAGSVRPLQYQFFETELASESSYSYWRTPAP
jgi:hypothetical protein